MSGVWFVAEKECGFGHHALRVEESSPGGLPALQQDLFKHRLAQLPAVEDRGKPAAGLLTHFRNEWAAVNPVGTHSLAIHHAIAQQLSLQVSSTDLLFRISQQG